MGGHPHFGERKTRRLLKGSRDTVFGINKFLLPCTARGAALKMVLNPETNGPLPPTGAVPHVVENSRFCLTEARRLSMMAPKQMPEELHGGV